MPGGRRHLRRAGQTGGDGAPRAVWITELGVSAADEAVLREALAHPAVEGDHAVGVHAGGPHVALPRAGQVEMPDASKRELR